MALAAAGAATAVLLVPTTASATTISVNSTGDSQAEDAACTLREAIVAANTNTESGNGSGGAPECAAGQAFPIRDRIEFEIAGAGPHVIAPTADLPDITQIATVDGSTDGTDEIALDGAPNDLGFGLRAGGAVSVDSLSIYGFGTGVVATGSSVSVRNSFIGTNEAGDGGIGNDSGISLSSQNGLARGNVISGNDDDGVRVFSTGNVVAGNLIGTSPAGTDPLANGGDGISVQSSADTVTIGGPNLEDANVVSGNDGAGISVTEASFTANPVTGVVIQGNRIGTGIGGQTAVANALDGISVIGNVSGAAITDNLISGNGGDGIELRINVVQPVGAPGPSQNTIAGNSIGTDIDGEAALANGAVGISISGLASHPATDNTIGGTAGLTPGDSCAGDCNLISSNSQDGIELSDSSTTGTQVLGNYVGTDRAGTVDLGNGAGINLAGASGGSVGSPAGANLVSGNDTDGIILRQGSAGNDVQANLIGVDDAGTTALANDGAGVLLNGTDTDDNLIGGTAPGEGNQIQHNEGDGVAVTFGALDNAILGNSMTENAGLGIDLGTDGVTPNDAGDGDTGENDLQNFPELEAVVAGGSTIVRGTLNSTAGGDFRIEVFDNADDDPTGHGEGQTLLGAFEVTTDASGDASFLEVLDGTAGAGHPVSATATELGPLGEPFSTSEFGLDVDEGTCDVTGTSGDDSLTGLGASDDVICGLEGDDEIEPDGGDDVIVGGDGTDDADYSAGVDPLEADLAAGLATLGTQFDLLSGIENVTGTDLDDVIDGDAEKNVLEGGDGKDTVEAGEGKDTVKGNDGKDTLKGQDDKDEVKGGDGGDDLFGGSGDKDDLDGNAGKDSLDGGGGDNDDCNGGPDNDEHDGGCEKKHSL
jgi:CSLREA domain-containing protein